MNEKQIQEVLELVDDCANHPSHEFRSAIERALREQVREVPDVDDLKDRLVAASEAVEDQDDRAAQAIIGEMLRLLSAAPQREPMTDEQIDEIIRKLGYASLSPGEVAREVEHFHGITKKEQQ